MWRTGPDPPACRCSSEPDGWQSPRPIPYACGPIGRCDSMPKPLRIDFVSDVSCPWCIIGLKGLEDALARSGDAVTADIHFQPFELNPDMVPEGEAIGEHL